MPAPKITVIMPIHNTPAEYLEECLDSVFAQIFTSFELVCVDDASDDEMTKALLDAYEYRHENMQVIHLKQKSGAAIARNTGFSYAKSEYVIFLDADDVFGEDFLLEMHQCIERNKADFCACGYTGFHGINREHHNYCRLKKEKVFDKNADDWMTSIPTAPWSKLCRRQFLLDNNIYFQSLSSSNDVFFHCMCMICAKKICVLERTDLVFYRMGSEGQISANRNPPNLYTAVALVSAVAPNGLVNGKLWNWSGAVLISGMFYELSASHDEGKREELYLLVRRFFRENPVSFEDHILQTYKNKILQLDYKSEWHGNASSLLWQLRILAEEIKPLLLQECDIYVWGMGNRGDAFQQFCKEEEIALSGIADIKDSNIGGVTDFGNQILSTEEILDKESGLLVASNRKIYEDLKEKAKCSLMNLEDFCSM